MAHKNLERVITYYQLNDYAATVFRIQLSVEQLQKCLLLFLGIQFRKTHEPSKILDSLIYNEVMKLSKDLSKKLKQISMIAKKIEQQETITRNGVKKNDELITPEEYYTKEKTLSFIDNLQDIILILVSLFESIPELKGDVEQFVKYMKQMEELKA